MAKLFGSPWRNAAVGAAALCVWSALYLSIGPLSRLAVGILLGPGRSPALREAVGFFLYDSAKILLLLVLMVYVVGLLRAGLNMEKVRGRLEGRGRAVGYVLAALFGAVTPFCSCSSVPLFLGFATARIPLGITMAFLIASPAVNEVAVVLLWGLLGWKLTVAYVAAGLLAGVVGGAVMDALRADRWLRPFLREAGNQTMRPLRPLGRTEASRMTFAMRHAFARDETAGVLRKAWAWVLVGVGVGALLHGYVPEEWFAGHVRGGGFWTVPVGVLAGIPLYTNVTGIVPVMESLISKGLPVGTTLAFCLSSVAVSLPEMTMLRQAMTWRLLALFVAVLLVLFTLFGWLLNALSGILA